MPPAQASEPTGRQRPLVIVVAGSGRHARVAIEAARLAELPLKGVPHEEVPAGGTFFGVPVLGRPDLLSDRTLLAESAIHLGTGRTDVRRRLADLVARHGGAFGTIVHPGATISPSATIGPGALVCAGGIVGVAVRLGENCIVNTGAIVDHDGLLGPGTNICPGARLAGAVTCEEDVFVGLGALILQGLTIGARAIVGAGAVVLKDVRPGATVVGCPAREIGAR